MTLINGKEYGLPRDGFDHPGGADLYQLAHGNDVTALIHAYHSNPEHVLNKIKKNQSTKAPNCDTSIYTFDSKFYEHVKLVVRRYFKINHIRHKDVLYLRTFLLLIICLMLYIFSLTLSPFLSPLFGISLACIGLCIQHDANHGAFSSSPKINHIMGLLDDFIGGSSLVWRYQHNLVHHTYCNDPKLDNDTKSAYPWVRFHETHTHLLHMKCQHFYALFLYSFIGFSVFFSSCHAFITKKYGQVKMHGIRRRDKIEFLFMKFIYISYMFLVPFYVFNWSFIWKFFLPVQLCGGFYLALLFSVSHNNLKVKESTKIKSNEWAVIQLLTSANWSANSKFWNIISGGLNCQIEHHLFPGISHPHYPLIHRVIKRACIKFNLPYNHYHSFGSILMDHLRFLRKLSLNN